MKDWPRVLIVQSNLFYMFFQAHVHFCLGIVAVTSSSIWFCWSLVCRCTDPTYLGVDGCSLHQKVCDYLLILQMCFFKYCFDSQ